MIIEELKEKLTGHIKKGDTVCLFSDITSFGIPPSLKEEIKKNGPAFLMQSYIDTFKNLIGEQGLLILPTFTYSATKKEIFDVQKTPSTVGSLTEYFRKDKGIIRSLHPIFSFAAWGKNAEEFLQLKSFECFGQGSLFDKMYAQNATYILFGVPMQTGATYIYYSEQKIPVHYRYSKEFTGIIRNNGSESTITLNYFVRDLNVPYIDSRDRLQLDALKAGIASEIIFNTGSIIITKSKAIDQFIQEKVKIDKDYLIEINQPN